MEEVVGQCRTCDTKCGNVINSEEVLRPYHI